MNKQKVHEVLAIPINATNDANPFQKLELKDGEWNIHLVDSFDLFFQNPKGARNNYMEMFRSIRARLGDENATKLSIKSHAMNIGNIQNGDTKELKMRIVLTENSKGVEFTIWTLCESETIQERLQKMEIPNIRNYWLEGIIKGGKTDGYKNLFNIGFGWGTHNIATTIRAFLQAFQKNIPAESLRVIAPNDSNKENEYALRTSLFCIIDGEKICIRTDTDPEKLEEVINATRAIEQEIDHILLANDNPEDFRWKWHHSVPTDFSENVFRSVLTVVFNCEDKEVGKVINTVISIVENCLKNESYSFYIENRLWEFHKDLVCSKEKFDTTNRKIEKVKMEIKNKRNLIEFLEKRGVYQADEVRGAKEEYRKLQADESELSNTRIKLLQIILLKLIELTELTQDQKTQNIFEDDSLGRVSLITNGAQWSVGFIEIHNHSIFFTNGVLRYSEDEKKLFKLLKLLSKWDIDYEEIKETTGCGDSSTAAALIIRAKAGREAREQVYFKALGELKVPLDSFWKAIGILEAYFFSELQKVLSWATYHCKKASIGDVSNSDKIAELISGFVFHKTKNFIIEGMPRFLCGDNTSERIGRKINDFNVYHISE